MEPSAATGDETNVQAATPVGGSPVLNLGGLAPGAQIHLEFTEALPDDAPNSLQGAEGAVSFEFKGEL